MFGKGSCPYCKRPLTVADDWCTSCGVRIFKTPGAPARPDSPDTSLAKRCFKVGAVALVVAGMTEVFLRFVR